MSEDSHLCQSLRKIGLEESKFLREIRTAEMEHEIERKVVHLSNKFRQNMIEETGIKISLNDEETREYRQVMNQIRPKNNGK